MTAQIISFAEKWHEREVKRHAKELERLFDIDIFTLNQKEFEEYIAKLNEFAKEPYEGNQT